ncbi:hypothetical protein BLNAU_7353 [Blattamonas nauphoetae]|uniref:Uncharacterized protein n=1 Tax=Blattamonas nauphoetae TaxID=2049346 RepID=A0ABQ9Y1X3_9EUKA|nr:hypothetical protein BLNAU_7353 [Blattamonas nauphoetae]
MIPEPTSYDTSYNASSFIRRPAIEPKEIPFNRHHFSLNQSITFIKTNPSADALWVYLKPDLHYIIPNKYYAIARNASLQFTTPTTFDNPVWEGYPFIPLMNYLDVEGFNSERFTQHHVSLSIAYNRELDDIMKEDQTDWDTVLAIEHQRVNDEKSSQMDSGQQNQARQSKTKTQSSESDPVIILTGNENYYSCRVRIEEKNPTGRHQKPPFPIETTIIIEDVTPGYEEAAMRQFVEEMMERTDISLTILSTHQMTPNEIIEHKRSMHKQTNKQTPLDGVRADFHLTKDGQFDLNYPGKRRKGLPVDNWMMRANVRKTNLNKDRVKARIQRRMNSDSSHQPRHDDPNTLDYTAAFLTQDLLQGTHFLSFTMASPFSAFSLNLSDFASLLKPFSGKTKKSRASTRVHYFCSLASYFDSTLQLSTNTKPEIAEIFPANEVCSNSTNQNCTNDVWINYPALCFLPEYKPIPASFSVLKEATRQFREITKPGLIETAEAKEIERVEQMRRATPEMTESTLSFEIENNHHLDHPSTSDSPRNEATPEQDSSHFGEQDSSDNKLFSHFIPQRGRQNAGQDESLSEPFIRQNRNGHIHDEDGRLPREQGPPPRPFSFQRTVKQSPRKEQAQKAPPQQTTGRSGEPSSERPTAQSQIERKLSLEPRWPPRKLPRKPQDWTEVDFLLAASIREAERWKTSNRKPFPQIQAMLDNDRRRNARQLFKSQTQTSEGFTNYLDFLSLAEWNEGWWQYYINGNEIIQQHIDKNLHERINLGTFSGFGREVRVGDWQEGYVTGNTSDVRLWSGTLNTYVTSTLPQEYRRPYFSLYFTRNGTQRDVLVADNGVHANLLISNSSLQTPKMTVFARIMSSLKDTKLGRWWSSFRAEPLPRVTEVRLFCDESATMATLEYISEERALHYVFNVLTDRICAHPRFAADATDPHSPTRESLAVNRPRQGYLTPREPRNIQNGAVCYPLVDSSPQRANNDSRSMLPVRRVLFNPQSNKRRSHPSRFSFEPRFSQQDVIKRASTLQSSGLRLETASSLSENTILISSLIERQNGEYDDVHVSVNLRHGAS